MLREAVLPRLLERCLARVDVRDGPDVRVTQEYAPLQGRDATQGAGVSTERGGGALRARTFTSSLKGRSASSSVRGSPEPSLL